MKANYRANLSFQNNPFAQCAPRSMSLFKGLQWRRNLLCWGCWNPHWLQGRERRNTLFTQGFVVLGPDLQTTETPVGFFKLSPPKVWAINETGGRFSCSATNFLSGLGHATWPPQLRRVFGQNYTMNVTKILLWRAGILLFNHQTSK